MPINEKAFAEVCKKYHGNYLTDRREGIVPLHQIIEAYEAAKSADQPDEACRKAFERTFPRNTEITIRDLQLLYEGFEAAWSMRLPARESGSGWKRLKNITGTSFDVGQYRVQVRSGIMPVLDTEYQINQIEGQEPV